MSERLLGSVTEPAALLRYGHQATLYLKGSGLDVVTDVQASSENVPWPTEFDPASDIFDGGTWLRFRTTPKPGDGLDIVSGGISITLTTSSGPPIPVADLLGQMVQS